jgi:predicted RNA binding protein YcfA (HicA-like mRNA interferase family)
MCIGMRATEVIRRLRREGWEERPGKGSHLIFRRAGKLVVIANHPGDIPTGTLRQCPGSEVRCINIALVIASEAKQSRAVELNPARLLRRPSGSSQ